MCRAALLLMLTVVVARCRRAAVTDLASKSWSGTRPTKSPSFTASGSGAPAQVVRRQHPRWVTKVCRVQRDACAREDRHERP